MSEKAFRSSLVDQVYSFIIKRIQSRQFLPGERLNIEDLAKEFGVSRTPIREAISRLTQEGFVVQNFNSGPCVVDLSSEQGLDIIIANKKLFNCVFQLMPGPEKIQALVKKLEDIVNKQEQTLYDKNGSAFQFASVQFHTTIINCCVNETLRQITLQTEYRMNMLSLYYQDMEVYRKNSIVDHKNILQAIRHMDWAQATKLMEAHNDMALQFFMNN